MAYVDRYRQGRDDRPFDVVLGGVSPGDSARARDLVAPLAESGATWWDERQLLTSDDVQPATSVLRRIEHGPPAV